MSSQKIESREERIQCNKPKIIENWQGGFPMACTITTYQTVVFLQPYVMKGYLVPSRNWAQRNQWLLNLAITAIVIAFLERIYPYIILSSWWLNQPLWKICSSNWVHLPQIGVKIKNIWNHHLAMWYFKLTWDSHCNTQSRAPNSCPTTTTPLWKNTPKTNEFPF